MSGVRVRAGAIVEAIQFPALTIESVGDLRHASVGNNQITPDWCGGKGGTLTEFLIPDGVEFMTGTISQFDTVNCVSSLHVPKTTQSVETVSVYSKTEIAAVVLYCKDQDRVSFFKDFRVGKLNGDVTVNRNGESQNVHHLNLTESESMPVPSDSPHEGREVKYCKCVSPKDCTKPVWSLELQGNFTNRTIKTVDVEGTVRCFSI
jgi:hypothetical protein